MTKFSIVLSLIAIVLSAYSLLVVWFDDRVFEYCERAVMAVAP